MPSPQESRFYAEHVYSAAPEGAKKLRIDLDYIGSDFSRGGEVRIDNGAYLGYLVNQASGGRVKAASGGKMQFVIIRGGAEGFLPAQFRGVDASNVVEKSGVTTSGEEGHDVPLRRQRLVGATPPYEDTAPGMAKLGTFEPKLIGDVLAHSGLRAACDSQEARVPGGHASRGNQVDDTIRTRRRVGESTLEPRYPGVAARRPSGSRARSFSRFASPSPVPAAIAPGPPSASRRAVIDASPPSAYKVAKRARSPTGGARSGTNGAPRRGRRSAQSTSSGCGA